MAELRARVLRGLIEAVASHTAAHRTLGLADRPPACLDAVPQLAGCLASEYPDELETATQLIVLVCLTRAGRAAFASTRRRRWRVAAAVHRGFQKRCVTRAGRPTARAGCRGGLPQVKRLMS